jgi:hypothetical protein
MGTAPVTLLFTDLVNSRELLAHTPFVGRRMELELLERTLRDAHAGQGSVAMLGGEPCNP